jgi:hypothetical protein
MPQWSEGVLKMGARKLTGRWLHVAADHWCALKAVVYSNGPDYPNDCVLSECGSWLWAIEAL